MLNLKGLKHSRSTNLAEGRISNQDAVLMGIAEGMSSTEIRLALKEWRGNELKWGKSHLLWYFISGEPNRLEIDTSAWRAFGKPTQKYESWYRRVGRGRYELTPAGWKRLGEIHGV